MPVIGASDGQLHGRHDSERAPQSSRKLDSHAGLKPRISTRRGHGPCLHTEIEPTRSCRPLLGREYARCTAEPPATCGAAADKATAARVVHPQITRAFIRSPRLHQDVEDPLTRIPPASPLPRTEPRRAKRRLQPRVCGVQERRRGANDSGCPRRTAAQETPRARYRPETVSLGVDCAAPRQPAQGIPTRTRSPGSSRISTSVARPSST